ncbi:mechanosensitive ion channel domain-containing protein [Arenicella xantha]|uniref:Small-conductance mechanosensitive channel n=1 Tax=Arenicella xantha TaxID=644221 RepID=A0A395JG62_9GAMM|nr:mechanosensitive ion channel domain-containing protein [Arenicella xantha]RBP48711.1 small-conductance mechanosensitive channel [Arenicella xantha]
MIKLTYSFVCALVFSTVVLAASAQSVESTQTPKVDEAVKDLPPVVLSDQERQEKIEAELSAEAVAQLADIQESLKLKIAERKNLRAAVRAAGDTVSDELANALAAIDSEISLLEETFEQIAIGGVDLSAFGVQEEKFDWREELVTIVKPLLENIKDLTEKPRKIENLRRIIEEKEAAAVASEEALASIERLQAKAESKSVLAELAKIEKDWASRRDDLHRAVQLAEYQLNNLEGKDVNWFELVQSAASDFVSGRGLTLLLVLIVAVIIWAVMRFLLWLVRARTVGKADRSTKTHYRLAAYGYKIFTVILIAVGSMMVLYFRQDLLLLAIVVVVFIGAALALKNLLPRYVAESRLLLNIGSVRERERLMYEGVPYQVLNINMYTRLANPEIKGALRLPLYRLHDMVSRPVIGDTSWFPSSQGDWVLDDDDDPLQVVEQTIETVKLRDMNATTFLMPTAEYYAAKYRNLSKPDGFRVAIVFGVDYELQSTSSDEISELFRAGVEGSVAGKKFEADMINVDADFHSAGDSSLNYVVFAWFKPESARYYNRIKRHLWKSCVDVCNQQGWSIPFPQLTVHQPNLRSHQTHND